MQVNSKQAIDFTIMAIKAQQVAMIHGDPGIGKSEIVKAIADKFNLVLIDIRLSQCDPTDLNGFPFFDKETGLATYIPMSMFPLASTELPEGKNGFLLFLDEVNSAPMAVQAASYKISLDKEVGQHKLHPKTAIVCAGNLASNKAIVNRMSTAMQSRLIHMELTVDAETWIEWASKNNIDHRITAYIHNRPENLHRFDPQHSDFTFACPRTWEFASKLLEVSGKKDLQELLPLLAGTLSEGVAREFIAYTKTLSRLPSMRQIVKNPAGALLDEEPAMLYAVSHMIGAYAKESNIRPVMEYMERMPMEFEMITMRAICRRNPEMMVLDDIIDWITEKGEEFII